MKCVESVMKLAAIKSEGFSHMHIIPYFLLVYKNVAHESRKSLRVWRAEEYKVSG